MSRHLTEYGGKIFEAKKDDKTGRISYPVVIISQGLGNLGDRNYYTSAAGESGVAVYEGKKAYYDHPTKTQSEDQPGRSVRETCGHYENCRTEKDSDGLLILRADFVPEKNKEEVINKLDHAIEFKKKYPLKDYIGISINGEGEGSEMAYDDFIKEFKPSSIEMDKIKQIEGQPINAILKLTDAVSADLVTEAGARGRILLESKKQNKRRLKMKFIEAMQKLLFGIEKGDTKLIEDAKAMLQSEGDDDKAKEAKEAADKMEAEEAKESDGLAKHLLAAKKELKKEKDEEEGAYETRCMKQARKEWKKDKEESAKKEAAAKDEEKKEKKESKDGDADADAKKDSKDKADEKKESKEADDDKGHDDADKDKALIKKMMKQMDELKKENADLKKEKESKESEAKGHQEDATKSKIVLMAKERAEVVDRVLAESGLPRYITNEIRPVIEKCKTKEEMKETCKGLSEAFHKSVEEAFYKTNTGGFVEISSTDTTGSNDSLFI